MICVGNLTAGGTGKTPHGHRAGRAAERARGVAVQVISRGHGGSLAGAGAGRGASGTRAAEVGDEPLLLAAFAPVWVGARPGRRRGGPPSRTGRRRW